MNQNLGQRKAHLDLNWSQSWLKRKAKPEPTLFSTNLCQMPPQDAAENISFLLQLIEVWNEKKRRRIEEFQTATIQKFSTHSLPTRANADILFAEISDTVSKYIQISLLTKIESFRFSEKSHTQTIERQSQWKSPTTSPSTRDISQCQSLKDQANQAWLTSTKQ